MRETMDQQHGRWLCRMAGVRYVGIQRMYGVRVDHVLFQPIHGICAGTTLAVPVRSTPISVVYRVMDAVAERRMLPREEAA